jgi:hypothetical protein
LDWARAIERNSRALTAIIAALFAMLGLKDGAALGRIERQLHRAVLRVLRPAESAVRRLIVLTAQGLAVKPSATRPMPKGLKIVRKGGGPLAFPLVDPPQRLQTWRPRRIPDNGLPRIWVPFDDTPPGVVSFRPEDFGRPVPETEDGRVNATRLGRRLMAIRQALLDLPAQARRLARWRTRRQAKADPQFTSPLRDGRPPGHRKRPIHKVDEVLAECQWLACDAMRFDTS